MEGWARAVRRWRGPSCGARFTSLTGTVLENCKKPLSTWVSFIRLALFAVPLDACAEACRITHQTAWEWRHRLFAADGAAQSGLSAPSLAAEHAAETGETCSKIHTR